MIRMMAPPGPRSHSSLHRSKDSRSGRAPSLALLWRYSELGPLEDVVAGPTQSTPGQFLLAWLEPATTRLVLLSPQRPSQERQGLPPPQPVIAASDNAIEMSVTVRRTRALIGRLRPAPCPARTWATPPAPASGGSRAAPARRRKPPAARGRRGAARPRSGDPRAARRR